MVPMFVNMFGIDILHDHALQTLGQSIDLSSDFSAQAMFSLQRTLYCCWSNESPMKNGIQRPMSVITE